MNFVLDNTELVEIESSLSHLDIFSYLPVSILIEFVVPYS